MINNAEELLNFVASMYPRWKHEIQRESKMVPRKNGCDHVFVVTHIPDGTRSTGYRGGFAPVTVPISENDLTSILLAELGAPSID